MKNIHKIERNPNFLEHLLIIIGSLSMIVIVTLTAFTTYHSAKEDVLNIAEDDAVRIGTVIVKHYQYDLFNKNKLNKGWSSLEIDMFDRHVKYFLSQFEIHKIKVFNFKRNIIYSNERDIIGIKDKNNKSLTKALQGKINSHLVHEDETVDLSEEKQLNADVVETYFPVYNDIEEIVGAMELYVDVTRYKDEIIHRVTTSVVNISAILIIVFAISYFIVRTGSKEVKSLLDRLHNMAVYDTLTGVYNRGAIIEQANKELSLMKRRIINGEPPKCLGIIMTDLDYFKKINDTYGHQAGDKVLCGFTDRIKQSLREYDVYGRWGGEEFVILLPETDHEKAAAAADRLRKLIMKKPFSINGTSLNITASFGVTCCYDPYESFDTLLAKSDEAMYEAKESGGNRVVSKQ
ncbi:MAG: GGDEF domain-containing protein [Flexistipes sinusarabici]|uniref:diguanylate cyclase n=1 Tax=Flexistipes sinusarabici TaxID=2352 RepID=A0A5D0MPV8_FLESI|nr:GGDEF domain-containing protein [Flexistipes sinusarabici]TYB32729.1 MAG: GGDEF domain-containing protein [Flexistipes sinusarabici]